MGEDKGGGDVILPVVLAVIITLNNPIFNGNES